MPRLTLRWQLTLLGTALVGLASVLLLWLGWLLVGSAVASGPTLPPGTLVRVGTLDVPVEQVAQAVRDTARAEVLRAGLIAFPLVLVAAGLVSWVLVGRVLAPLHEVTATARRLSTEGPASLDRRLDLPVARGELAELAGTFDAMLDRLQAAFEVQRRFVANASHELRTPLAVLRTEVDVTLADPAADVTELRRMGDVVRDATRRADDLVSGLLLLARTESLGSFGALAAVRPVDLAEAAAHAVRVTAAEAGARGLRVVRSGAPAPVVGDPALLERVAGNLVENAVRHNVDGGWVEITTGPGAWLRVSSSGPEIDAAVVEQLFEPFRRGPVPRTGAPGSGLGLSIVRAVVAAHGGDVRAEPVVAGGLTVTVALPGGMPEEPGQPAARASEPRPR